MAWFRCIGGDGGGGSDSPVVDIFNNGQWLNTDIFSVTVSTSGASDIYIVGNNLVYGSGTTGFSVSPVSAGSQTYIIVIEYEATSGFFQTGRCNTGADAKLCTISGTGRFSWHNFENLNTQGAYIYQGNTNFNQGVFFGGHDVTIHRIFGIAGSVYGYNA